jgi:trimethylamine--corrinoid protein Co-methyltransferase
MSRRSTGGRAARLAHRAAPLVFNPAIYQTALRLLAELGMGEVPDRLADIFLSKGATRDARNRILFPNAMVEDCIDMAAKRFPLHGRDPNRTIEVGGDSVHFGTGGAAVQTLDMKSGLYRPSTLRDLHDFTRLQDTLTNGRA